MIFNEGSGALGNLSLSTNLGRLPPWSRHGAAEKSGKKKQEVLKKKERPRRVQEIRKKDEILKKKLRKEEQGRR